MDAAVRIEAAGRAGRERLLRYCTTPPFALERRRELDPERLLYESAKLGPGGNSPLVLTPLELLDRLAVLVPPPRIHRHRHYGVRRPTYPACWGHRLGRAGNDRRPARSAGTPGQNC